MAGDDSPAVFKTDVALTRVDAQVLDQSGRAVTGLRAEDFVLRVDGKPVQIRNFASENMPLDVLLLLDVSGSMEPHVERIATAARQALNVLAPNDRVAIMVFDTNTRVRLPFRNSHDEVTGELDHLLHAESFAGGTRITGAILSGARYIEREGRPEARRAIVILTDDETQDAEDEGRVEKSLAQANAILSFLQAPYEPPTMHRGGMPGGGRRGGTWGGGGGGWPGSGGGGWPGGGGIGFPRRGGVGGGDRSHSAGTEEIARETGGDTMSVDQASALEDTLARLRQRYALHFYVPEGSKPADQQRVQVTLAEQASIRYNDAQIRYRQIHFAGGVNSPEQAGPLVVERTHAPAYDNSASSTSASSGSAAQPAPTGRSQHIAVNEDSGSHINTIDENSH